MTHTWNGSKMPEKLWSENLKGRPKVNGRIILK
jgi:hypothetical protein